MTTAAVRGFQAKREIPVTGEVDQRTLDRLHAMTTEPTEAELANEVPSSNGNARPARRAVHDRPGAVHRQDAAAPCAGWSTARCG